MPDKNQGNIDQFIFDLSSWLEKRRFYRINEHYGKMAEVDAKIRTVELLFNKGLLNNKLTRVLLDMIENKDPRIEDLDIEF